MDVGAGEGKGQAAMIGEIGARLYIGMGVKRTGWTCWERVVI